MQSLRHHRVCELLKRQLGEVIRREFNVTEVGLITVNQIVAGGDLKSATAFISILGNSEQQKRGLQVLEEQRIRLQGLVAKGIVLKYTPTLRFVLDDSVIRGNRVLQIIEELEKTSPQSPEPPADEQE